MRQFIFILVLSALCLGVAEAQEPGKSIVHNKKQNKWSLEEYDKFPMVTGHYWVIKQDNKLDLLMLPKVTNHRWTVKDGKLDLVKKESIKPDSPMDSEVASRPKQAEPSGSLPGEEQAPQLESFADQPVSPTEVTISKGNLNLAIKWFQDS